MSYHMPPVMCYNVTSYVLIAESTCFRIHRNIVFFNMQNEEEIDHAKQKKMACGSAFHRDRVR